MAKTERPITDKERGEFEGLLSGEIKAPDKACLKCGEQTLVRDRLIKSNDHGDCREVAFAWTAQCRNSECGAVYAKRQSVSQSGLPRSEQFFCGGIPVTLVDGDIHTSGEFPMKFTDRQCTRAQQMLDTGMVPA